MFTNINIIGNGDSFKYIVEYQSTNLVSNSISYTVNNSRIQSENTISFWDGEVSYLKQYNNWIIPTGTPSQYAMPEEGCKLGEIRLYFPTYSADYIDNNIEYSLTAYTWINGKPIVLGSFIFDRSQAIAGDSVKKFDSIQYYEVINFNIIDVRQLLYSDDWKNFRIELCGEKNSTNIDASIIYFALDPIEKYGDSYVKSSNFSGGQNSINLFKKAQDKMSLHLSSNTSNPLGFSSSPELQLEVKFNDVYEGNLDEYIEETYLTTDYQIDYELVIGNEDNIYLILEKDGDHSNVCTFSKSEITANNFSSWSGWEAGIYVVGSANIILNDSTVLTLMSNKLPLSQNLYRYYVKGTMNTLPNYVKLEYINMNLYNINAVNKIENKVIKLSRPSDSKSNIIQPTFFRTTELSNIMIHPAVTETICINLDQYKSKVDTFILQIEDICFEEIGRTSAGILFKVVGKKLPNKISEGSYYILDQNMEMVTFGKYKYMS